MLERYPIQKFHGDECLPILLTYVVNGADVGVIERGCGLGFALKSGKRLWVTGNLLGQKLESNETMQSCVFCLVHHAHTATTEFVHDPVVRDDLSYHQKTRGFSV